VVPKPHKPSQMGDMFHMVVDLSAKDSAGVSVNGLIDVENFVTHWDGACQISDYVHLWDLSISFPFCQSILLAIAFSLWACHCAHGCVCHCCT
jgi:hypothetical protein